MKQFIKSHFFTRKEYRTRRLNNKEEIKEAINKLKDEKTFRNEQITAAMLKNMKKFLLL